MPPPRLFALLHPVVPSRAFHLTVATCAAAAPQCLHHTHCRSYSLTESSRSRTQTNQHLSPNEQEHEQEQEQGLETKLDDDYYALILSSPLPTRAAALSPYPSTPQVSSTTTSAKHPSPPTHKSEPRVIFGSRLAGPAARQREGWAQERPEEPDNCCMSGCVNCVWDTYREEVEEWAANRKKREAEERRAVQVGEAQEVEGSVGDLGGLGEAGDTEAGALFEGVPVGIKEFMALEKRLRGKERERDRGGKVEG